MRISFLLLAIVCVGCQFRSENLQRPIVLRAYLDDATPESMDVIRDSLTECPASTETIIDSFELSEDRRDSFSVRAYDEKLLHKEGLSLDLDPIQEYTCNFEAWHYISAVATMERAREASELALNESKRLLGLLPDEFIMSSDYLRFLVGAVTIDYAQVLVSSDRCDEAKPILLSTSFPDSSPLRLAALWILADCFTRESQFDTASSLLAQASDLVPTGNFTSYQRHQYPIYFDDNHRNAQHHYQRGRIAHRRGNTLAAREEYQHALELNPGHVNAYLNLGITYAEEDKITEASQIFSKPPPSTSRKRPLVGAFEYNTGLVSLSVGDLPRARQHFQYVVDKVARYQKRRCEAVAHVTSSESQSLEEFLHAYCNAGSDIGALAEYELAKLDGDAQGVLRAIAGADSSAVAQRLASESTAAFLSDGEYKHAVDIVDAAMRHRDEAMVGPLIILSSFDLPESVGLKERRDFDTLRAGLVGFARDDAKVNNELERVCSFQWCPDLLKQ